MSKIWLRYFCAFVILGQTNSKSVEIFRYQINQYQSGSNKLTKPILLFISKSYKFIKMNDFCSYQHFVDHVDHNDNDFIQFFINWHMLLEKIMLWATRFFADFFIVYRISLTRWSLWYKIIVFTICHYLILFGILENLASGCCSKRILITTATLFKYNLGFDGTRFCFSIQLEALFIKALYLYYSIGNN